MEGSQCWLGSCLDMNVQPLCNCIKNCVLPILDYLDLVSREQSLKPLKQGPSWIVFTLKTL